MKLGDRKVLVLLTALLLGAVSALADPVDLRHLLESTPPELAQIALPKDELDSIYAARDYKPAWSFSSSEKEDIAKAFVESLEQYIAYHGLRSKDYPIELIRSLSAAKDDKNRNLLDLLVTASLLRLAHDLHGDMNDLDAHYTGWKFHRAPLDLPALLAAALANGNVNDFVGSLVPKNPAYAKLASALHVYRAYASKSGWGRIDPGPPLRPDDHDPRVLQLRARLEAEDYLTKDQHESSFFDEALQKAVMQYQLRNGLEPDGHIGEKTLAALNTPLAVRIEQIRANMERWRHMPDDFPPDRYAAVNLADASIRIVEGGKEIYQGPVVIGKIDRKTPFIESRVRSMIVNPPWHVPIKIARKDILPKLKKDPHYLEKLGIIISGHQGDPYGSDIDWSAVTERNFHFVLRQAPGDLNSLGHLKFDFENDFAVYMHGTPHQELFAKAQRNYSSGCIRLRDPDRIGELILENTPGHWDLEKIQSAVDEGKTKWVMIKNPLPLYVLYWSVFTDESSGAVNFRKDVYDYDGLLNPS